MPDSVAFTNSASPVPLLPSGSGLDILYGDMTVEAVTSTTKICRVQDLGLIDYGTAYCLQKKYVTAVLEGDPPVLLLCEHPSVLTMGRLADEAYLLASAEELKRRGVSVHRIDRGGEITLHAPGQLVVYPILNLAGMGKDLHAYLRRLEQVAIDLLGGFGIVASRLSGRTGVWTEEKKIASIGIGVRKWVSFHGLALNVGTDLDLFSMIKPCGLDVVMTSMSEVLAGPVAMADVKAKIVAYFEREFHLNCAGYPTYEVGPGVNHHPTS